MLNKIQTQATQDAADHSAFEFIPGTPEAGIVITCDHASNAFPPGYGTLGVAPEQLERHIAYDIGAAGVARRLAALLGAPAVLSRFSRLLIDPNRAVDDPTLVMRISDGAVVPGNAHIDAQEIQRRINLYYRPYHAAIEAVLDAGMTAAKPPVVFSVHSFTDNWRGTPRPWHATILWDRDPRFAKPLVDALHAETDIVAGENVPYTGRLRGDSMYTHGTRRGLAHALIEIRQDLIRTEAGQAAWAQRLARIIAAVLTHPRLKLNLHRVQHYGSFSDNGALLPHVRSPHEEELMSEIDPKTAIEIEAAVFRRLVAHLRERVDVQNIDMMNLAGFCRNCLSNWYGEAAGERGYSLSKDEARMLVYGMSYDEWKRRYQTEATDAQRETFEAAHKNGG
jgi:predicted N-formylglutamate amidohydrolase